MSSWLCPVEGIKRHCILLSAGCIINNSTHNVPVYWSGSNNMQLYVYFAAGSRHDAGRR